MRSAWGRPTIILVLSMAFTWLVPTAASAESDRSRLAQMLVTKSHLPSGFRLKGSRYYTAAQLAREGTYSASELRRWGYLVGFNRRFTRNLKRRAKNPGQISANGGAYKTSEGAGASLSRNGELCKQNNWRPLPPPAGFGSQVYLCTRSETYEHRVGQAFFIAFRVGRFKSSITVTGLRGRVTSKQAISIAKVQRRRVVAHAS